MTGWTMPIQSASYRGVRLNVLEVTDSFERTVVEHSYPFVNGADLEDMGLTPHNIQLQAVFWGSGYYLDLKKFLATIQSAGADVLVHPILGRLPNMICVSASIRHEADYVNYALLELSFREATPAKPIFVFESSLLANIDSLINELESAFLDSRDFFLSLLGVIVFVQNAKSRLLNCWTALFGVFEQLTTLFDLDKSQYRLASNVNKHTAQAQSLQAVENLIELMDIGLTQIVSRSVLTVRSGFDEVLRTVQQIERIPLDLVTGRNDKPLSVSHFSQANFEYNLHSHSNSTEGHLSSTSTTINASVGITSYSEQLKSKLAHFTRLSLKDVQEVVTLLNIVCTLSLAKIAVEIIEEKADELIPSEIEYIHHQVRTYLAKSIALVRALQKQDSEVVYAAQRNTDVYTVSHQLMERLRHIASEISRLATNAINRKPPLIVRESEINGTIHQVAYHFYGDYHRASELLRLNPHIRQPNFIEQGDLINAYAK